MIGYRGALLGAALLVLAYIRREPPNIILQEDISSSYDYIIGECLFF